MLNWVLSNRIFHQDGIEWMINQNIKIFIVQNALWNVVWEIVAILLRSYCDKHPYPGHTLIARIMGPTWGPPGSCRPQVGPILAPWTLLSGYISVYQYSKYLSPEYIYIYMYIYIHGTRDPLRYEDHLSGYIGVSIITIRWSRPSYLYTCI